MPINTPYIQGTFDHQDVDVSLRFGFIGLGMGGCAIATECASIQTGKNNDVFPYSGILVNTNTQDFNKLHYTNKEIVPMQLKGFEKGAARNIAVGERAFMKHQQAFLELVDRHFKNRDFLWVVCGLGGGTGTGSILQVVNTLHQNGYDGKFGLILILPRDREGGKVFQNALNRLQKIAQAMKFIGSVILVDNNKLYKEFVDQYSELPLQEYMTFANQYIAHTLHELNVVTSSFSPWGEQHFDASEFENLLKTPGILHLSRVRLDEEQTDLANELTYTNDISDSIERGLLSHVEGVEKSSRSALSVVTNVTKARKLYQLTFSQNLETVMDDFVPYADEKPVSLYAHTGITDVHVYGLFAGLDLPRRIKELVDEAQRIGEKREELSEKRNDVFDALASFKATEEQSTDKVDDLFGSTEEEEAAPTKRNESKEGGKPSLFDVDMDF